MVWSPQIKFVILTIILFVTSVGCAGPQSTIPFYKPPVNIARQIEVYTAGYRNISEKYIKDLKIAKIALGGIQGLSSIDPAVQTERNGKTIRLLLDGLEIASAQIPEPMDARSWGNVTAIFERAARQQSRLIKNSGEEKVYEAVFDGVVADLDVFSRYAGAEEARRNRARREGFGGIGIRFKIRSGKPIITKVHPNMPAAAAGIEVDDQITHINGSEVINLEIGEVANRIRGQMHSDVTVRVYRSKENRHLEITMNRKHIVLPTVTAEFYDNIAYIKISSFNQATAASMEKELKKIRQMNTNKFKGLIIDLRGNPGGLLKQSVKVADLVLTDGNIVSTLGRHPDSLRNYEASGADLTNGWPIVVLVDGKTASASEIVAAALQDLNRAVVVGTSSFGKGTVQTVIRLPNNGEINLTWSRFIAPSGYALHGLGVRPEVCTSHLSGPPQQALDSFASHKSETRAVHISWRKVSLDENKLRKALRKTCASERRKTGLEKDIAKIILSNPSLYSQALELTRSKNQTLR